MSIYSRTKSWLKLTIREHIICAKYELIERFFLYCDSCKQSTLTYTHQSSYTLKYFPKMALNCYIAICLRNFTNRQKNCYKIGFFQPILGFGPDRIS